MDKIYSHVKPECRLRALIDKYSIEANPIAYPNTAQDVHVTREDAEFVVHASSILLAFERTTVPPYYPGQSAIDVSMTKDAALKCLRDGKTPLGGFLRAGQSHFKNLKYLTL